MIVKNKLIAELDKLDCIRSINDYTNNCNSHDDIVSTIEEAFEDEEFNSAKDIFKKLGYEYSKDDNTRIISYKKDNGVKFFMFLLRDKNIITGGYSLSVNELRAINQQSKELGWL